MSLNSSIDWLKAQHKVLGDSVEGIFVLDDIVGFITGVLTLTPFAQWRRDHALHHASSGDLDRRGHGDIPTLTVQEYLAKSRSVLHSVAPCSMAKAAW